MHEDISVLLAHDHAVHMCNLRMLLEIVPAQINEAATLSDVARRLNDANPPYLVFTDLFLVDAPWLDVLSIANRSRIPIAVIVAPRLADVYLYLNAVERGAFDLMTPPFSEKDVKHIFRSAVHHITARRKNQDPVLAL